MQKFLRTPLEWTVIRGGRGTAQPDATVIPCLWPWIATAEWVECLSDADLAIVMGEQLLSHLPLGRTTA